MLLRTAMVRFQTYIRWPAQVVLRPPPSKLKMEAADVQFSELNEIMDRFYNFETKELTSLISENVAKECLLLNQ